MKRIPLVQDEWLLCLELYLRHRHEASLPNGHSAEMQQLSDTLRRIYSALYGPVDKTFRPPRGIEARVRSFRYLDPLRPNQKAGQPSKEAQAVWNRWGEQPYAAVAQLAQAIRNCLLAEDVWQASEGPAPEYGYTASEGKILTRVHTVRERNNKLVDLKKELFQDTHGGVLYCEACRFDFARSYPKHGEGFMECHHIKPLPELQADQKTTLDDLALLCANCHRMIHYRQPWLSMGGLQTVLHASAG